jgi:hypothetical protein
MKEEKPKLVLNKRTIAHLNNFEMRNVRGGDGDGDGISQKICVDTDKEPLPQQEPSKELLTIIKVITNSLPTRMNC